MDFFLTKIVYDIKELNNFLDRLPVLATKEYLAYKSDSHGWFVSENFILPFYLTKKIIFKRIFFTTEPININNASKSEEVFFLNDVVRLSKMIKVDIIELPGSNAIFNAYPDKALFTEFGTYRLDLAKSEEELFKNLHPKHRNVIRKAEKDSVIIKFGAEYIDNCYNIIKRTYMRQGKDFISFEKFNGLKKYLNEQARFYIALKNDIIQGCAVLLWNKNNSSYYLYGGSIENPYTGSLNLMHWQAIKDMKNLGVAFYDFFGARINPIPGSKLEGIQRFKERFGGELKTGFLWKYPVNKIKYNLFQLLTQLYYLIKFQKFEGDIIEQKRKRKKNNSYV